MENVDNDTIECENCGAMIPVTAKKCPECGIALYIEQSSEESSIKKAKRQDNYEEPILGPRRSKRINATTKIDELDLAEPIYVIDFDMPFSSIVIFMIKVAIASIPAMIVLIIMSVIFWVIFGGIISAIVR